jgi:hypothetical protein
MPEHTTNYYDTLILIAPDCPVEAGSVPPKPGTVAAMQYERLAAAPYSLTSDDLIFDVHADRNGVPPDERDVARAAFFSKGQPCLRSSPLVKSYGWGVHHDGAGRVAVFGAETPQYRKLAEDPAVTKVHGMRSKRQSR